ncbi:MAG: hypothetical protein HQM00_11490 [Magnetococcales bacterium]|nr:hypothetical protein [Magnetococcales bacterium]
MKRTMTEWITEARQEMTRFGTKMATVPYEAKGILFSEMFFFYLGARSVAPRRILESGRARGQSTLILSLCFPELPVISIEHDPDSPDVPVAAQRLAERNNVELLFGDARVLLPDMAREGDVVLIDGPKGFAGLRLAFRLLASGKVAMVFIHDVGVGSPERAWLERIAPEALYSDHPEFAKVCHHLDGAAGIELPEANRFEQVYPRPGYGYTLACLPGGGRNGWTRRLSTALWSVIHRLFLDRRA